MDPRDVDDATKRAAVDARLLPHRLARVRRDKIHDLCFKCKDKTQLWKPVTDQSVVVHIKGHQAMRHNFVGVHQNFTAVCDDACLRATLSFDVASLKDLCGRGTISRSYSKCKLVM